MPVNTIIDVQNKIVFSRAYGVLIDDEMIAHEKWLYAHPDFHEDFNQFVETIDITENLVTPDGVRLIAKISRFSERSRRVYLIKDDLTKGYSSIHGHLTTTDTNNFISLPDAKKACDWLGISIELYLAKREALINMAKDNG